MKLSEISIGEAFGFGLLFIFTVMAIHGLGEALIYPHMRQFMGVPKPAAAANS